MPAVANARDFGILTLATPNDYLKAIGLRLSLKVSNPKIPVAVACSSRLRGVMSPHFDLVLDEKPGIRGFIHKVYLDQYSPFSRTLFFDSDVLVFKDVRAFVDRWPADQPYNACGIVREGGISSFGLDRAAILKKIDRTKFNDIGGAGHALFSKPSCHELFDMARRISENYSDYAGSATYADEDAVGIVMSILNYPPMIDPNFLKRHFSAKPGTLRMDASIGLCSFIDAVSNERVEPCMIHFADNEAPLAYSRQLIKLYRKFGVPTRGIATLGFKDYYQNEIRRPISRKLNWLKKMM